MNTSIWTVDNFLFSLGNVIVTKMSTYLLVKAGKPVKNSGWIKFILIIEAWFAPSFSPLAHANWGGLSLSTACGTCCFPIQTSNQHYSSGAVCPKYKGVLKGCHFLYWTLLESKRWKLFLWPNSPPGRVRNLCCGMREGKCRTQKPLKAILTGLEVSLPVRSMSSTHRHECRSVWAGRIRASTDCRAFKAQCKRGGLLCSFLKNRGWSRSTFFPDKWWRWRGFNQSSCLKWKGLFYW